MILAFLSTVLLVVGITLGVAALKALKTCTLMDDDEDD